MPSNITETSEFTSPLQVPNKGGDDDAWGDINNTTMQGLANRTTYLKDQVDDHETRIDALEGSSGGSSNVPFWLDAAAMKAEASGGATFTEEQTSSWDNNADHMLMNSSSRTLAVARFLKPAGWSGTTFQVKFVWGPATGATAGETVVLGAVATAVGNDESLDAASGSEAEVQDTVLAVGDLHITSAVTVSWGAASDGDLIFLKAYRDPSDALDSMDESLKLYGLYVGPAGYW